MAHERPAETTTLAAWAAVAALGFLDLTWAWHAGIAFIHTGLYVAGVVLLLAGAALLRRAAPGLASIAHAMALFLAFLLTSESLSFLCATTGMPLQDARLAAVDRALGFDWMGWAAQVWQHPLLYATLTLAYFSYVPQFTASIAYYAFTGRSGRAVELLWLLIIAFGLTMAVFALLPAKGPWVEYDVAAKLQSFPVTYFAALRGGALHVVDVLQVEGVVDFPSFHAVYAVLLTYVHRGERRLFPAALALNAVMLLSLPVPGGHYLADIIVGLLIAGAAIALWSLRPRRAPEALAIAPQEEDVPYGQGIDR
jgi:hypothetical protein